MREAQGVVGTAPPALPLAAPLHLDPAADPARRSLRRRWRRLWLLPVQSPALEEGRRQRCPPVAPGQGQPAPALPQLAPCLLPPVEWSQPEAPPRQLHLPWRQACALKLQADCSASDTLRARTQMLHSRRTSTRRFRRFSERLPRRPPHHPRWSSCVSARQPAQCSAQGRSPPTLPLRTPAGSYLECTSCRSPPTRSTARCDL